MVRERFKFDASVFCIVRREERVLAVRRSGTGWLDGHWSLPAGAHDGNESYLEGALRELREETSLIGAQQSCSLAHVQQVFTEKGEWLALYFSLEEFEGVPDVAEPEKHDRVEWQDLLSTSEPVIPYVREALREIASGSTFSIFTMKTPH